MKYKQTSEGRVRWMLIKVSDVTQLYTFYATHGLLSYLLFIHFILCTEIALLLNW